MANKKGDKYKCDDCGLVILVEEPCPCETSEIVCCGAPMKLVSAKEKPKATAAKPKPKLKK